MKSELSVLASILAIALASGANAAPAAKSSVQPPAKPSAAAPAKTPAPPLAKAAAQPAAPTPPGKPGLDKAVDIATQPVRDVGVTRHEIPPALIEAADDPYSLEGLKTCKQLTGEIVELNGALGPDFEADVAYKENRVTKLAEAGGKTVVNSIIPFRGLVREVSGAATADRKLRAAEQAGFARRGFLRGAYATRGCRPRL